MTCSIEACGDIVYDITTKKKFPSRCIFSQSTALKSELTSRSPFGARSGNSDPKQNYELLLGPGIFDLVISSCLAS